MNQQEESMKDKALIQCVIFFYEKREMQAWLYQKRKIPCKYRKKCVQFKNTRECDVVGYMFDYISSK